MHEGHKLTLLSCIIIAKSIEILFKKLVCLYFAVHIKVFIVH